MLLDAILPNLCMPLSLFMRASRAPMVIPCSAAITHSDLLPHPHAHFTCAVHLYMRKQPSCHVHTHGSYECALSCCPNMHHVHTYGPLDAPSCAAHAQYSTCTPRNPGHPA